MIDAIMNQRVDLSAIKNGVLKGLDYASNQVNHLKDDLGVLSGRVVRVVKSGIAQAGPYLQNKYMAAGALFAVSSVFLAVGDLVYRLAIKVLPTAKQGQEAIVEAIATGMALSVWAGGSVAFCYYSALPLHPAVMAAAIIASPILSANYNNLYRIGK